MVEHNQLLVFSLLCFLTMCVWRAEPTAEQPRFVQVVYRVGDLNRTTEFYEVCFGLKLLKHSNRPARKYSYAIMGYGPQETHFVLKLIYNYGVNTVDVGTGFGHITVLTPDARQMVEVVRANGGVITREPGTVNSNGTVVYAFVLDPNGYTFEIVQMKQSPQPLSQLKLNVLNYDRAIQFYRKALGMKLLVDYRSPEENLAMMGYGSGPGPNFDPVPIYQTPTLEVAYTNTNNYTKGNGYSHVVISTSNMFESVNAVKIAVEELGGMIIRLPRKNSRRVSFLDPEGWKTVLVEE